MSAVQQYRFRLNEYIEYNVDLTNLLNFLTQINFTIHSKIAKDEQHAATNKEIATKQINDLHDRHVRSTFFRLFSVYDLLPADITQYILSFNSSPNQRSVCKLFKRLYDRNTAIQMKQRNIAIKDHIFAPRMSFDPSLNTTHTMSTCDGYSLQSVLSKCNSGDKIIINEGTYVFNNDDYDFTIDIHKNIQIIGVGRVIFKDYTNSLTFVNIDSNCIVYMENIQFDCHQSTDRYCEINVSDNATLSMDGCKLKVSNCGIIATKDTSLNIRSCEFIGGASAIEISSAANHANIVGSVFTKQGRKTSYYKQSASGSICVSRSYDRMLVDGDEGNKSSHDIELKCVGNIFSNNLCFPIRKSAELSAEDTANFVLKSAKYILKNNILRGYNVLPTKSNIEISTANAMHLL